MKIFSQSYYSFAAVTICLSSDTNYNINIKDTTWPVILQLSTNLTPFYIQLFWYLLTLLSSTIPTMELCKH